MYPVATKKKVTLHQEELSSSSCVDHLIIILKTYLKNFEEMDNSLPGNSSKTCRGWMLQKKEKSPISNHYVTAAVWILWCEQRLGTAPLLHQNTIPQIFWNILSRKENFTYQGQHLYCIRIIRMQSLKCFWNVPSWIYLISQKHRDTKDSSSNAIHEVWIFHFRNVCSPKNIEKMIKLVKGKTLIFS